MSSPLQTGTGHPPLEGSEPRDRSILEDPSPTSQNSNYLSKGTLLGSLVLSFPHPSEECLQFESSSVKWSPKHSQIWWASFDGGTGTVRFSVRCPCIWTSVWRKIWACEPGERCTLLNFFTGILYIWGSPAGSIFHKAFSFLGEALPISLVVFRSYCWAGFKILHSQTSEY